MGFWIILFAGIIAWYVYVQVRDSRKEKARLHKLEEEKRQKEEKERRERERKRAVRASGLAHYADSSIKMWNKSIAGSADKAEEFIQHVADRIKDRLIDMPQAKIVIQDRYAGLEDNEIPYCYPVVVVSNTDFPDFFFCVRSYTSYGDVLKVDWHIAARAYSEKWDQFRRLWYDDKAPKEFFGQQGDRLVTFALLLDQVVSSAIEALSTGGLFRDQSIVGAGFIEITS